MPLSLQQGDYIQLTTFDGQSLILPDEEYKMTMWGGFGAPPINYITKQGYRQHGETEIGYILQKRPITVHLHRKQASTRAEYWRNRATIHDFLRPDRNGPLTLTVVQGAQDDTPPVTFRNSGSTLTSLTGTSGVSAVVTNIGGSDFWGRSPRFFVGQLILIDAEQMIVTAINVATNTMLVTRAANGSIAATHSVGAVINSSLYPFAVSAGARQRSIVVRADPGLTLQADADREANWYIDEDIKFIAFNPIWFDPVTTVINVPLFSQQNLVFPITFPILFGTSGALFSQVINYTGSWYAYPTITLNGPYSSATITNQTTGISFTMNVPIVAGTQRVISTTPGSISVVDGNGVNAFGELGPTSDLVDFNLRPDPEIASGVQTLNIILAGSSGNSAATISYQTQYFGI